MSNGQQNTQNISLGILWKTRLKKKNKPNKPLYRRTQAPKVLDLSRNDHDRKRPVPLPMAISTRT